MKNLSMENNKFIFKLMLALTVAVTAVVTTLIVFAFLLVEKLGLLSAYISGIGMLIIIVMTAITIWRYQASQND